MRDRVRDTGLPVVYVNLLGGQDELVFDGGSFVMNAAGEVVQRRRALQGRRSSPSISIWSTARRVPRPAHIEPHCSEEASVYGALVLGVRDYVGKHRFPGRRARFVGRHRFGADARDCRRCAGRRSRARGDDAVALHLADEPR